MANFGSIFFGALLVCAVATFRSSDLYKKFVEKKTADSEDAIPEQMTRTHRNLLKRYLLIYLLATLSDWLQGPYVYALYGEYGFEQQQIAQLFVAGFGSSMIFGSFMGGMADWGGRRTFVILFTVIYATGCITKHFKSYGMLMIGRLLGGVATSLLFSVFEAWLIRAHADADLPKSLLAKSFSWAAFGNSLVAIMAGLVANGLAAMTPFTSVTPTFYVGNVLNAFDLAFVALVACGVGAKLLWEENYGDRSGNEGDGSKENDGNKGQGKWYGGLQDALTMTFRSREIFLCGAISSLFEGSMYIFVFMWTPLFQDFHPEAQTLPFGLIFSTFMLSCMTGSSIFSVLVDKYSVERVAVGVFSLGALAMGIVAVSSNSTMACLGMNLFEICVGMYFPTMGTMKGGIVPESKRAAIYNLYRIPLNFIVLSVLLSDLQPSFAFVLTTTMLTIAAGLQVVLTKSRLEGCGDPSDPADEQEEAALLEAGEQKTKAGEVV